MSSKAHISQEELELYALQSRPQDDAEYAAFAEHLADCAQCANQLAQLRGEWSLLALISDPTPAPDGSRARFMNRIAADAAAAAKSAEKEPGRMLMFPRLAWAAAAAFALIAFALQYKVGQLTLQLDQTSQQVASLQKNSARAQQVLDALTSHSAQHILLTAAPTAAVPSGRAVYVAQTGSLIFQANNLKQIASDKTYELWVIPTTGAPIPAGTFRPDPGGTASVVLPTLPTGVQAKAFGVTIEKSVGSASPNMSNLVMVGAAPAGE